MHFKNKFCLYATSLCLIFFLCCTCCSSIGGNVFEIKRIGNIHSYEKNAFLIHSTVAGEMTISIHDDNCVYRTLSASIEEGETRIEWDGCAYNKEKLYEKTYTITAVLKEDSGCVHTTSFQSPVEYAGQYLQYALPSSENLYLDAPENWFIEFKTVQTGSLMIALSPKETQDETPYRYKVPATGGKIIRKDFSSISRDSKPQTGSYIMTVYEISRPDEIYQYPLTVTQSSPEKQAVTETGAIMPERDMTEEQIWNLMMRPSVVVDIDFFKHQDVYEKQDTGSKSLGTLHGQTQGLEVIRIEGTWAYIGAWNHETAEYIEGWVPLEKLKTEKPSDEYGILVDKRNQTMTVYCKGKKIDTIFVSTGRAEKNSLYQETSAGSFLTGYHRVNFSMNGKKYDYVIQYDGGNLLHQTPYDWGKSKKDFTYGRGYLGAKASHACIRIQPEPGQGGINAYWLFTHLPYHTRVIILDDPEERKAAYNRLMKTEDSSHEQFKDVSSIKDKKDDDHTVTMTFGGNVIPGGNRTFNSRRESLISFAEKIGYQQFLSSLVPIFSEDDLTCISLGGVLEGDQERIPDAKDIQYGPKGMNEIFRNASVEMIIISDDAVFSRKELIQDTIIQAQGYADVMDKRYPMAIEMKGHLFGFAACSESEYLSDCNVISNRIKALKEMNCEKIIFSVSGKDNGTENRTIIQEAMANRSVIAGADLVIFNYGGQAKGIEYVRGVPVVYNTGILLDGSTSQRPKHFASMLLQAEFDFEKDNKGTEITLIPVCPYGYSDSDKNNYQPECLKTAKDAEKFIRLIRRDSSDADLTRTGIRISD